MKVTYITLTCILTGLQTVFGVITDSCPSRYTITSDLAQNLKVKVKRNPRYCDKLLDTESPHSDLDLRSGLPYQKHGDYFLNITWPVRKDSNGRFPKKFAILLDYSIPERNISDKSECIVLKLVNKASELLLNSFTMYLDCIKLFDDTRESRFSIQVWQLPGPCGGKRSKRSTSACGQILQSNNNHYPLSLAYYKREICSCYYSCNATGPELQVEAIYSRETISFIIEISNLPSFLLYIHVVICGNEQDNLSYRFDKSLFRENGSLIFPTDSLPQVVGTYTLQLYYKCTHDSGYSRSLPSSCHSSDKYNFTLVEVNEFPKQNTDETLKIICMVFGGLVIILMVTTAFIYLCRNYWFSSDLSAVDIGSYNNTDSGMETFVNEDSSELHENERSELLPYYERIPVVSLNHRPDLEPVHKDVIGILGTKHFKLQDGRDGNWQEFASGVFTFDRLTKTRNLIIFLSKGFLELLFGSVDMKKRRLEERQYENVPSFVFEDLKLLPAAVKQKIVLHIVSTYCDKGRELTREFVENRGTLNSIMHHTYYFHKGSLDGRENQLEFVRLVENLNT